MPDSPTPRPFTPRAGRRPCKRARRTPFDGVAIELHLAGPSRAQGLTKESKEIVPNENSSAYKHRSHDHIYESDFGVRAGLE